MRKDGIRLHPGSLAVEALEMWDLLSEKSSLIPALSP